MDPNLAQPVTIPTPPPIPRKFPQKNILLIVVLILILLALLLLGLNYSKIFKIPPKPKPTQQSVKPSPIPKGPTLTGLEIAKQTAVFLDKTLKDDGSITEAYMCFLKNDLCSATTTTSPTSDGYIAQAYYELFLTTNDNTYKEKALKVAEYNLAQCAKDKTICSFNFIPFYYFYKQTGDNRYKDALVKLVDTILKDSPKEGYVVLWGTSGSKLAILYELTGDKTYTDRLETITKKLLANFPVTSSNPVFYKEGDFIVSKYAIQVVWDNYLTAYRITKNPIYLQAAKDFFQKANPTAHLEDFKNDTNGENLSFVETLLNARDLAQDPKEKAFYTDIAKELAGWAYINLSDNPQNKKANGDFGFLFDASRESTPKMTVQSAWRARQYLKMANETFAIK